MRQLIPQELARAAGIASRAHSGTIDLQFRLLLANEHLRLSFPLSEDGRLEEFSRVSDFMALLMCPAFILSSEISRPDAIVTVGVSRHDVMSAMMRRVPSETGAIYGPIEWLPADMIGSDIRGLLPPLVSEISKERASELSRWFGPSGKYPVQDMNFELISDSTGIPLHRSPN